MVCYKHCWWQWQRHPCCNMLACVLVVVVCDVRICEVRSSLMRRTFETAISTRPRRSTASSLRFIGRRADDGDGRVLEQHAVTGVVPLGIVCVECVLAADLLPRVAPTGAPPPSGPHRLYPRLLSGRTSTPRAPANLCTPTKGARESTDVHSPTASSSGSTTAPATEAEPASDGVRGFDRFGVTCASLVSAPWLPASDGVLGFDRFGVTCASSVSAPWLEAELQRRATGRLRLRLLGRSGQGNFSPEDAQCSARANCAATSASIAPVPPRPSRRHAPRRTVKKARARESP